MSPDNLIDLPDVKRLSVSRFLPIERLEQIFQQRNLVLLNIKKWEDPYENFFLQCYAEEHGERITLEQLRDSWYGLCWTKSDETDAMWRIYSQPTKIGGRDFQGVRIRTTLDRLTTALWEPANRFSSLSYFAGAVSYLPTYAIEEFLDRVSFTDLAFGGQGTRFAQTLLMKRQAFAHEDEVRLLAWISGDQTRARVDPIDRGLFRVPIDPHALVEEVLVDPRLLPAEAEALIRRVRLTGYSGLVRQSELYKFTPRAIRLSY
jgi:hypothetical protein